MVLGQPLVAVALDALHRLPVSDVIDDVDALQQGQALGHQVAEVDQARSVSRSAAEKDDLENP